MITIERRFKTSSTIARAIKSSLIYPLPQSAQGLSLHMGCQIQRNVFAPIEKMTKSTSIESNARFKVVM